MTTNIDYLPQITASFILSTQSTIGDVIRFVTAEGSTTPLDITGIAFDAIYRPSEDDERVLLRLSTDDGTLVNGGVLGTLSWSLPEYRKSILDVVWASGALAAGTYGMWLKARADGKMVDLCEREGPASVTVRRSGARP